MKFVPIVSCLFAALTTISVQAEQPIDIRIGHFLPAHLPINKGLFTELTEGLNRGSGGKLRATLHPAGELEASPARYLDRLRKGDIDIALIVPSYSPKIFPDYELFLLPNLFSSVKTASEAHHRLATTNRLRGYEKIHVVAAFTADPFQLHLKDPYSGLQSMRDRRLRVAPGVQEQIASALAAQPVTGKTILDIPPQLDSGQVDAALVPWTPANAFKLLNHTKHHVNVNLGYPPLILAMNREKYQSLSSELQAVIDGFSGKWVLKRTVALYESMPRAIVERTAKLPEHIITILEKSDADELSTAMNSVISQWASKNPNGANLVAAVRDAIKQ